MDRFVNQFSEIGKLNAVMLHRPGDELNQVTPDFFDRRYALSSCGAAGS